jgi:hypothetical protein
LSNSACGGEAIELFPGKYDTFFSREDGWVERFLRDKSRKTITISPTTPELTHHWAGGPGLDFETWVVFAVETEPRRFQKDWAISSSVALGMKDSQRTHPRHCSWNRGTERGKSLRHFIFAVFV